MKPEDTEHLANRWLDAGLNELGQAEPRLGLAARVLANLETEAGRRRNWRWQWWPAFATVLVVAAVVLFELNRPQEKQTAVASEEKKEIVSQETTAKVGDTPPVSAHWVQLRQVPKKASGRSNTNGQAPRLEQFPSPHPLSEQEKLLAQYVEERPQEAMVVAKMRAELLKQDMRAFEALSAPPQESQDAKP